MLMKMMNDTSSHQMTLKILIAKGALSKPMMMVNVKFGLKFKQSVPVPENADPRLELYIKVPKGMIRLGMMRQKEAESTVYTFCTIMHWNIDASLQFFMKFCTILIKLGQPQSKVDPCVFFTHNEADKLVLILATMLMILRWLGNKKKCMIYE